MEASGNEVMMRSKNKYIMLFKISDIIKTLSVNIRTTIYASE
jgi:hypothetical protein